MSQYAKPDTRPASRHYLYTNTLETKTLEKLRDSLMKNPAIRWNESWEAKRLAQVKQTLRDRQNQ